MWKTSEGSTGRLLQLCMAYFSLYVMTGVAVKYFLGSRDVGLPGMNGVQYLLYSTIGSASVALLIIVALRWYRMPSRQLFRLGPLRLPREFLYIVPSGICTGVVIPTTTLMYTLPISVLVAMVIMRGAIIVVSRLVDAIQIRQGLLHKTVYAEENWGVFFAMLAVSAKLLWTPALVNPLISWLESRGMGWAGALHLDAGGAGNFEFLRSRPAMGILTSYVLAYAVRIYVMNYYKNTRAPGERLNNKAFFSIEQFASFVTLVVATVVFLTAPAGDIAQIRMFQEAAFEPHPQWGWAALSGLPFGMLACFSVFIFMFKGRTATFAGLVNRLTSLVAGTTATLVFHWGFGGRFPTADDWLALFFIFVAIGFLSQAERKRSAELQKQEAGPTASRPVA